MELRITGLEQVQRALVELPRQMAAGAFAAALNQGAGVIAGQVEQRAARLDTGSETPLAEHVTVEVTVRQGDGGGIVGIASIGFDKSPDERTGIPQDLKAYLLEYGHRMVGHKPDKKELTGPATPSGEVRPQPIMRPAAEESWERAVEVFADTLLDSLSYLVEKG